MIVNLVNLFNQQKELDKKIHDNFSLTKKETLQKRTLALLVELGEMANEIRCFKFWSSKSQSERSIILEEYVDVLHFILSIGLDYDVMTSIPIVIYKETFNKDLLTNSILELTNSFLGIKNKKTCTRAMINLIEFGYSIGFTFAEIEDAYYKKNEVNHQRQKENY